MNGSLPTPPTRSLGAGFARAPFIASEGFSGGRSGYVFRLAERGQGYYLDAPPKVSAGPAVALSPEGQFEASLTFEGLRKGAVFKAGDRGVGYYLDTVGKAALESATAAEETPEARVQMLKKRGNLAFRHKKFQHALELYERALEIVPRDALLHGNCSLALQKMGKVKEALGASNSALEACAGWWLKGWVRRGQLCGLLHRHADAVGAYDAGVQYADRADSTSEFSDGGVLDEEGKRAELRALLSKGKDAEHAALTALVVECHALLDKAEAAKALGTSDGMLDALRGYAKILELDPTHVGARFQMASHLLNVTNETLKPIDRDLEACRTEFALGVEICDKHAASEREVFRREMANTPVDPGMHFQLLVNLGSCLFRMKRFEDALPYFARAEAMRTDEPMLYVHWGMALARLGRSAEVDAVHGRAVAAGLWRFPNQRPCIYDRALTAQPWWDPAVHKTSQALTAHFLDIRREAVALLDEDARKRRGSVGAGGAEDWVLDPKNPNKCLNRAFKPYRSQALAEGGEWGDVTLLFNGMKHKTNCARCPRTAALLERLEDVAGMTKGSAYFSLLQPGSHLTAHCGPSNLRLRCHLGIRVPEGARIRVGDETRAWKEGECLLFDDSFDHEVWQDGAEPRLVLIVDVWHPGLNTHDKRRAHMRDAAERQTYDDAVFKRKFKETERSGH